MVDFVSIVSYLVKKKGCRFGANPICLQPLTSLWSHRLVLLIPQQDQLAAHVNNDQKCTELNWVCVPMAEEVYGAWGEEAQHTFSRLAAKTTCDFWHGFHMSHREFDVRVLGCYPNTEWDIYVNVARATN